MISVRDQHRRRPSFGPLGPLGGPNVTKSFDGAEAVAQQYPQYASQITAAAKQSFLDGDQWAYTAGIVAVLLGALLVFFAFPKKDQEQQLLAADHDEDVAQQERQILTPA